MREYVTCSRGRKVLNATSNNVHLMSENGYCQSMVEMFEVRISQKQLYYLMHGIICVELELVSQLKVLHRD